MASTILMTTVLQRQGFQRLLKNCEKENKDYESYESPEIPEFPESLEESELPESNVLELSGILESELLEWYNSDVNVTDADVDVLEPLNSLQLLLHRLIQIMILNMATT
jgi:hypothetical protein